MKKIILMLGLAAFLLAENLSAQITTVEVCITNFATLSNEDCDGIGAGDSDFEVSFGGNNHEEGGNNGPFSVAVNLCETISTCGAGNIDFTWEAYEDDAIGSDGGTGNETISVDPTNPPVGSQTASAASEDGGCPQTYEITWNVNNITIIPASPDDVCNAVAVAPDQPFVDYAWCANNTLEANEPTVGGEINDGTGWFYFTATCGDMEITTDGGNTEIGTKFALYHSANGVGCGGVNLCDLTPVKEQFDYFSDHDFSDSDVPIIDPSAEADQDWDCGGLGFGPGLIVGETYFIQMTSDNVGDQGIISIQINCLGGEATPNNDVPCTALDADPFIDFTQNEDGITPEEFDIPTACSYDDEFPVDDPSSVQYHPNDATQDIGSSSVWISFTAPNSGRIYAEFNCPLQGEQSALYAYDTAFGPAVPGAYSCADITGVPDDPIQGNGWSDGGSLGGNVSTIQYNCLEPGYTYYIVADEPNVATCDIDTWIYDPSVVDAANNNPGNDIMCLALADPLYEVPVNLVGNCGAQNLNGDNTNACIESLAGEPVNGGGHTNWHYFTVPPSGSVEIEVTNGSIAQANFNVYPTSDGTTAGCYGGLAPSVYEDAAGDCALTSCVTGSSSGGAVTKCCLTPGEVLAIQIDGGANGDMGSYTITINEIDINAGNVSYTDPDGDPVDATTTDPVADGPAVFCSGEILTPTTNAVQCPTGNYCADAATCNYPLCLGPGFVLHDTPTPANIAAIATMYATIDPTGTQFPNDGSLAGVPTCQLMYVSALVDDDDTNTAAEWGDFCTSARVGDTAPVVFLDPISLNGVVNVAANCDVTFDLQGGLPCFDGSEYSYDVQPDGGGASVMSGTSTGGTVSFTAPSNLNYDVIITDAEGCTFTVDVDATACTSTAVCAITNVTTNVDGACNGNDTEFEICFDVVDGSGSYDIIDTDNGNAVIGSTTGAPLNGNVCVQVTITGPTTAGTMNVNAWDNADNTCVGPATTAVNIPECPVIGCNITNGTWSK